MGPDNTRDVRAGRGVSEEVGWPGKGGKAQEAHLPCPALPIRLLQAQASTPGTMDKHNVADLYGGM